MDLRARRATVRGEVVSPLPGERRLRFGWLAACAAIVGSASVAGGCGGEAALDGELHLDLVDRLATAIVVGEPLADSEKKILVLPGGSSAAYSFFARGATALRVEGLVVDESGRLDVWVETEGESAREVATFDRSRRSLEVGLGGVEGMPLRVVLRADGENGVVLRSPSLWSAAPGASAARSLASETETDPAAVRPNILIYLIDTLRRDHLGVYGFERPVSPQIDAFAEGATVYEDAVGQSTWTKPAVASMFTGVWPPVHGATGWKHKLPENLASLPEVLQGAGYRTGAVVANPNIVRDFGFARGFDDFTRILERPSPQLNEVVFDWLENADDRPFFLYVHTMDPHAPYRPPEPWLSRFAPRTSEMPTWTPSWRWPLEALPFLLDLYDAEIAFNDDSFGALLRRLVDLDAYDDTLIVLVSDHGEEFKEHGRWRHGANLFPATLHVPLIVKFPGQTTGVRVERTVQQSDLMPTLLAAAGIGKPRSVEGRDLRLEGPSDPLYSHLRLSRAPLQHSVIDPPWKLIRRETDGIEIFLFNRAEDPAEVNDLSASFPVRAAALSTLLAERLRRQDEPPSEEVPLSPEIEEAMKGLGYLQ